MALPDNFLYKLKQSNPIDSVMSSYTHLIKRGHNYVCLCPFHSEKSPSCTVYASDASDEHFFCYGCQAGGDVITFIMKIENLDYIEAVRLLAERAGIPMPDNNESSDFSRLKSRVLEINRATARFYYEILTKSPLGEKGRRYFAERQLSANTIKKYGLGFSPNEWSLLSKHLHDLGFTDREMVEANVCVFNKNGGVYDRFRDRAMFPIIDLRGNVIAFGGRIIDGEGAKYLNTSDTPVFKKSRNLFSMNFAKACEDRTLILAEGYMDVISINQAGFSNVVATLGTALTQEQASLMKRYADDVIIAYDSDGAGQNATHKAINLLSEAGIRTRIIKMTDAKDPDEFIKKFGTARFKQLLDKSDGAIDFELSKCRVGLDVESDVGKIEYLKRAIDVLSNISSSIEREVYISKIASETGVHKQVISQQTNGIIKKRISSNERKDWNDIRTFNIEHRTNPDMTSHPREYKAEIGIISYLSLNPDQLEYVTSKISPDNFVTNFNKIVFEKMIDGIKNSSNFDIMSLQSEFSADDMGKITKIVINSKNTVNNKAAADDYIAVLQAFDNSNVNIKEMSDDDFLKHINNIKKKK